MINAKTGSDELTGQEKTAEYGHFIPAADRNSNYARPTGPCGPHGEPRAFNNEFHPTVNYFDRADHGGTLNRISNQLRRPLPLTPRKEQLKLLIARIF